MFYRQYVVHVLCKVVFWYFAVWGLMKLTGLQEPVNEIIDYFKGNLGIQGPLAV
jgi:hypothetical protein